ncbi:MULTISPECIES: abortive infection family protein [Mycobacteriaceae]|uniref:abortive infection family protein n=1 Tax=Mycobacteriaceae TaxID=1762 RepID=UPI001CD9DA6F|nr:abortive infection family protein [Mycobacterium sp. WUMAC-067]MCA2243358.1 abortive infection family protein [Mycobacterium sp. WUMAC-067]
MSDLIELGAVLSEFFDRAGPSHDELDQAFAHHRLTPGDPAPGGKDQDGRPLGKVKRVRRIFRYATDHHPAAGLALAQEIVSLLRADGAFTPTMPGYAGQEKISRLAAPFRRLGLTLGKSGDLLPTVIDNLAGTELTDTLLGYVRRINLNPDDAALQIGTGKELDEATARHVLVERTGSYPQGGNKGSFPVTLANAFTALGLAVGPDVKLDDDPHRAVQQCLFLLGTAVNRLRNEAGTGHGKPGPPTKTAPLTPAEARLVARTTALLAAAMLDVL